MSGHNQAWSRVAELFTIQQQIAFCWKESREQSTRFIPAMHRM